MKNLWILVVMLCGSYFATAQKEVVVEEVFIDSTPTSKVRKAPLKNEKVITIRFKGDKMKEEKVVVEIDGSKIKVNGKDVADLKDIDVTIGENRFYFNGGRNQLSLGNGSVMELQGKRLADAQVRRNNVMERLNGIRNRAVLGIGMEKVNEGVKITDVTEASGAAKAGLKEDDVITKINDKDVKTEMDITTVIGANKPGTVLDIAYLRNGKKETTKATLGERKVEGMVLNKSFDFNNDSHFGFPAMPPMENFDFKFDGQMPDFKVFEMPRGQNNFMYFGNTPKLGASLMETEDDKGLEVTNVEDASVAAKAGLQKGDIITKVGDKNVKTVMDIRDAVKENKDKTFDITFLRNGKEQKVAVKFPKKLKEVSL